jgi:uncharacterized membrane protein YeaQ/YmgE (transglycosylase-associated protein family)
MEFYHLLLFLLIGLAAGFLAGKIMKGSGFGPLWDIIIGVVGSFIGGFLFWLVGLSATGIIGQLIAATVGALALLYGIKYIKKV